MILTNVSISLPECHMLIYLWLRRHSQGRAREDLQLQWCLRLASLAPVDGALVLFRSGLDIKRKTVRDPALPDDG